MRAYRLHAKALLGMTLLVLSACASPSSQDMYGGAGRNQTKIEEIKITERPALSPQRRAALAALGLDQEATPQSLVGLDQFDIKRALGDPGFLRVDEGIEIWQYRTDGCILDLFLYPSRQGMIVDHTDLRGPMLDTRGELDCFRNLILGQG